MEVYEIINYVLLGLTALLALIGALKGLNRGVCRQTVRLLTIVVSIVIAFFLSRMIGSVIFNKLEGMTVEELIAKLVEGGLIASAEDLKILTYFDTTTIEYILAIPLGLIILPLLFAILFPIVSGLMLIVHAILSGILGFTKKKNNVVTRLLGMALGAVQGVLVTAVILVPVIGIVNTVGDTAAAFSEGEAPPEGEESVISLYTEYVEPVREGPVFKTVSTFGGQLIYELLASVKLEDTRVNMTEQVDTVVEIYGYTGELRELDMANLTDENKAAIDAMIGAVKSSEYFSPLLVNITKGVSKYAKDSDLFQEVDEPVKTLLTDILSVFESSTKEYIGEDIDTFRTLFYLLSDEGVLASVSGEGSEGDGDMLKLLSKTDAEGKTVIQRAINILSANERTKPIVSSLTKIALSSMAGELGGEAGEEIVEIYDGVKEGLNELIKIDKDSYETEEEYRGAVAESLNETLLEHDIQLTTDVVEGLADHVVDNYGELEEISDEQITDIILEYYGSYVNGDYDEFLPEGVK